MAIKKTEWQAFNDELGLDWKVESGVEEGRCSLQCALSLCFLWLRGRTMTLNKQLNVVRLLRVLAETCDLIGTRHQHCSLEADLKQRCRPVLKRWSSKSYPLVLAAAVSRYAQLNPGCAWHEWRRWVGALISGHCVDFSSVLLSPNQAIIDLSDYFTTE